MAKKLAAECLGTFALVFAGTGAIVIDEVTGGGVSHVGVALTFGLIVLAMIYSLGDISGAHINPAVTIGFWAARRFQSRQVLPYVVSQCAGAFLASIVLRLLFPANGTLGATIPTGPLLQAFVLELILTALLMFVILGVSTGAREKGITAGIVVGSVIGLEAMFAGPICGASMNPARSLGPAVVSFHLQSLWIYLLAPTIGALGRSSRLSLRPRSRLLLRRDFRFQCDDLNNIAKRPSPIRVCMSGHTCRIQAALSCVRYQIGHATRVESDRSADRRAGRPV